MSETEPVSTERDGFISKMLNVATYGSSRVNLREYLGKRYGAYEALVLERVRYIDTPPAKRPEGEAFQSQFRQRAREAGFSGANLRGITSRASTFYQLWLRHKHGQQAAEQVGVVSTTRGYDPNTYLEDGSGRRQLGYIQSLPKET